MLISPTNFSAWFIKTEQRDTNLKSWPFTAVYARAALHHHLGDLSFGVPGLTLVLDNNMRMDPFFISSVAKNVANEARGVDKIREALIGRAVRGYNRKGYTPPKSRYELSSIVNSFGPKLEDLPEIEAQIRKYYPAEKKKIREADSKSDEPIPF